MQEAQETQVRFLGREDPLEKEMATHTSIPAGRNPRDRGAWWATVHGVAQSRTQLSDHSTTTHIYSLTHIYKEKLHKTTHAFAMCKQIISSILFLKILFLLLFIF